MSAKYKCNICGNNLDEGDVSFFAEVRVWVPDKVDKVNKIRLLAEFKVCSENPTSGIDICEPCGVKIIKQAVKEL